MISQNMANMTLLTLGKGKPSLQASSTNDPAENSDSEKNSNLTPAAFGLAKLMHDPKRFASYARLHPRQIVWHRKMLCSMSVKNYWNNVIMKNLIGEKCVDYKNE